MDIKHFPYFQVISNENSTARDSIGEHYFPIGTIVEVLSVNNISGSYNCAAIEDDTLDQWSVHRHDLKQLHIQKEHNGFSINWHEEGGFLVEICLDNERTYELYECPRYGGEPQYVGDFNTLNDVLNECEKRT